MVLGSLRWCWGRKYSTFLYMKKRLYLLLHAVGTLTLIFLAWLTVDSGYLDPQYFNTYNSPSTYFYAVPRYTSYAMALIAQIIFGLTGLVILFHSLIILLILKSKHKVSISIATLLITLIIIAAYPTFSTAIQNITSCNNVFVFCNDELQTETNKFGDPVQVVNKVDSHGTIIKKCEYLRLMPDNNVDSYIRVMDSIPMAKVVSKSDTEKNYVMPSGGTVTISKQPFYQDSSTELFNKHWRLYGVTVNESNAIRDMIASIPSCAQKKSPLVDESADKINIENEKDPKRIEEFYRNLPKMYFPISGGNSGFARVFARKGKEYIYEKSSYNTQATRYKIYDNRTTAFIIELDIPWPKL